jgi:hypothetical protein
VDSIYYDISANNILKSCMTAGHKHGPGAGRELTEAYRNNYINTKEAMINAAGKYIPMGTEMINEVFLDILDYYQARAGAQPATGFEGWNIRPLIKTGEAELIPMFDYVYHEYGPVRMDGWGKLTSAIGNLFYFTVARTYLWGGLYELNYEYSPMEAINGMENLSEEHYCRFDPRGYELDAERGEYISQFAALRTGKGNRYLAYGKMLEPLDIKCDTIELDWYNYAAPKNDSEYNETGKLAVDSIIHSAWKYQNSNLGLFFSNIKNAEQKVKLQLDMAKYGLPGVRYSAKLIEGCSEKPLFTILPDEKKEVEITLPPRTVVMLEICM